MKSFKFDFNRSVTGFYKELLDAYLNKTFVEVEKKKYYPFEISTFIEGNHVMTEINCTEGGN